MAWRRWCGEDGVERDRTTHAARPGRTANGRAGQFREGAEARSGGRRQGPSGPPGLGGCEGGAGQGRYIPRCRSARGRRLTPARLCYQARGAEGERLAVVEGRRGQERGNHVTRPPPVCQAISMGSLDSHLVVDGEPGRIVLIADRRVRRPHFGACGSRPWTHAVTVSALVVSLSVCCGELKTFR